MTITGSGKYDTAYEKLKSYKDNSLKSMYEFILLSNLKIENSPYKENKYKFKINEDKRNYLKSLADNIKGDLRLIMSKLNKHSQYF